MNNENKKDELDETFENDELAELCVLDGLDTPFGKPDKPAQDQSDGDLDDLEPCVNPADPEDLDRTYYDWSLPQYDYGRPIRATDVQYRLTATEEEVEEIIAEMKRTNSSAVVVVPYYEDGKLQPDHYEGLLIKEFCTRHLLDHDSQYSSQRWSYTDGVFHFAVFYDEMKDLLAFFHYRLDTEMDEDFLVELTAKRLWYEENRRKYEKYTAYYDAYREWALDWMKERRQEQ